MSESRPNPRAERTRAALLGAARRLLAERPVDAVTVDDMVQAAGVGKGSFYNHFEGREGLVAALSGEIRAGVEAAVARVNAAETDPGRRMIRAVCTYLRYAVDEPERTRLLVRLHGGHAALGSPLNRGLRADIEQGLAAGRFTVPDVDAGVLFVLGLAQITMVRVAVEPQPEPAARLAQDLGTMLLRGLGLASPQADQLAAEAADEIVRRGAFAQPSPAGAAA
ncbi:TetR/AcrR family transcriptional regulator [Caulobacter sp. KR2-114]|uniref:TetR/AcrR family transcriptional regulator n=1 Tax=Caulobacter sp. KR2-114 TaxID=3400912 RepID=UPI003C09EB60